MFGPDSEAEDALADSVDEAQEVSPESPAVAEADLTPGQCIGPYRLREKIGEGGFAVVFRAEQDKPMKRQVALKVLKMGMDTRQVVARFEAERQALALMDHPHIARVVDAGATRMGRPFFVMELVQGISMTDYCDHHRLSTEERLRLFIKVCQAVEHAHQKGILHRDLKPSNILVAAPAHPTVTARGIPKVIDFGIAKATQLDLTEHTVFTQVHHFIGTPAYMSPEQLNISGADVDTRSDIYSLGVLLYQLLTGRIPFGGRDVLQGNLDELRRAIREKEPVRPSTCLGTLRSGELADLAKRHRTAASKLVHRIKGDLDWIVMKCLEKDRARRYVTAHGLARDIERHLHCEPVVARPPSVAYRARKFVRRNRLAVATSVIVALALLAGAVVSSIGFFQANQQRQRADLEAQSLRTASYGANLMNALYLHESAGNSGRAMEALAKCPEEMRDWEWDYLRTQIEHPHRLIASGLEGLQSAVFTPDGRRIVSRRASGLYQLWDVDSGREVRQFQMDPIRDEWGRFWGHHQGPRITEDSERMVLFDDHKIVVWSLSTGQMLQTLTNSRTIAVHFAGNEFVSVQRSTETDPTLVIWNPINQRRLSTLELPAKSPLHPRFSPDGKVFLLGQGEGRYYQDNPRIDLWTVAGGGRRLSLMTDHLFHLSGLHVNWERHLAATVSSDWSAKVFDFKQSHEALYTFKAKAALNAVALSHDGRRLIAGGTRSDILMWNLSSATPDPEPSRFRGHASMIQSLRFSPDDRWILSSSQDGTIRLWDAEPYATTNFSLVQTTAKSIVFNPDGRELLSLGRQGTVRRWDALTGREMALPDDLDVPLEQAAYNSDGSILATLERESSQVSLWDTTSWRTRPQLDRAPAHLSTIAFIGRYLVAFGVDYVVSFWDPANGSIHHSYALGRTTNHITAGALSKDGQTSALSWNHPADMVFVYRTWNGELKKTLSRPASGAQIRNMAFSPDGTRLAAALDDNSALVWDVASGRITNRLLGHTEPLNAVVFSPSGRRLLSGGEDDSVKIWKLDSNEELLNLTQVPAGNVELIRFSPDGRTLVVIHQFQFPYFYRAFTPSVEVRRAR